MFVYSYIWVVPKFTDSNETKTSIKTIFCWYGILGAKKLLSTYLTGVNMMCWRSKCTEESQLLSKIHESQKIHLQPYKEVECQCTNGNLFSFYSCRKTHVFISHSAKHYVMLNYVRFLDDLSNNCVAIYFEKLN